MKPKLHLKQFIIDMASGQKICNCGCGQVVEERMQDNSRFEREGDESPTRNMSRPHNKLTTHDSSLSTEIGNFTYGRITQNEKMTTNIFILKKWQQRVRENDPKERRLSNILQEITAFVGKLQIPRTLQEDAAYLARKWVEFEQSEGRLVDRVSLALLMIASKRSEKPMEEDYFSQFIKPKSRKYFFRLAREMKICLQIDESQNKCITTSLIHKICHKMEYTKSALPYATGFFEIWKNDASMTGKSPKVVAAVCVSFFIWNLRKGKRTIENSYGIQRISQDGYSMTDVAEAAGVTLASIRGTIRDLDNFLEKNKEAISRL